MKTILCRMLALVLLTCTLTACSGAPAAPKGEEKLHIVATIFPEYDWVMNVLGEHADRAEVTLLLGSGVDLHSFQPSAADILRISSCDLFLYVGGTSDAWASEVLRNAENPDMAVIDLLETLGDAVREEELTEGMQEDSEAGEEGEIEYDEHVWLSLRNAEVLVGRIGEALAALDPERAGDYRKNAEAYGEKLRALDAEYAEAVSHAAVKTLLFGDRFPFRYLTEDYGLRYYAAFSGCSAETEASFETIVFLAGKADELSLPAVLTIEGGDRRIAETIVQNTRTKDQRILTLDSMQSVTDQDIRDGTTYLSIMERNLTVLKDALQ